MQILVGHDYELHNGRTVTVVQFLLDPEYAGWLCWPHGTMPRGGTLLVRSHEFKRMLETQRFGR